MASLKLRKRADGTEYFQATATLGKGLDKKPIHKSKVIELKDLKAKTPKKQRDEAKRIADAWEEALKDGETFDAEHMTYAQLFEKWQKDWMPRHLSENQQETYEYNIQKYGIPAIGHFTIKKLRRSILKPLVNDLTDKNNLKPETVHKIVTALRSPLNYAIEEEIIDVNPFDNIKLPTIQKTKELECFDERQTDIFLKALDMVYEKPRKSRTRTDSNGTEYTVAPYTERITIPIMWRAYFYVAIFTGCRPGEMVAMQWRDINSDENTITVERALAWSKKSGAYVKDPKANSFRKMTVPKIVIDLLMMWKDEQREKCRKLGTAWKGSPLKQFDEQYIFTTFDGDHMCRTAARDRYVSVIDLWNEHVQKEIEKAEDEPMKEELQKNVLPYYRPYDMRHSNASIMLAHGVPITTVSQRLGHSRTSITLDVYSHALPSTDEKAVKALESSIIKPQAGEIITIEENTEAKDNALELSPEELRMILEYRNSKQNTGAAASVPQIAQ